MTFNLSPTVEAKDLIRAINPEGMDLADLKLLERRVVLLLNKLWNLTNEKAVFSQHEKANIILRRNELDQFHYRIRELMQVSLSAECYLNVAESEANLQPKIRGFKI